MWGLVPLILRLVLTLAMSIFLGGVWAYLEGDFTPFNLAARMLSTVSLLAFIGMALGSWTKWSWTFLQKIGLCFWYPDLNGKWSGKLVSTFGQDGPTDFDVTFTIDQRWSRIKVCGKGEGGASKSKSKSRTLYAIPEKDDGEVLLWMIFRGVVPNPEKTDDPLYYGCSRLVYDKDKDILEGHHWTNRAWQRELNTAGTLRLERTS